MRRRTLIAALGGALAWSFTAEAQQRPTTNARIGIVDDAPIWDQFRQGLRDLGYIDGQNIAFEYPHLGPSPDGTLQNVFDGGGLDGSLCATLLRRDKNRWTELSI